MPDTNDLENLFCSILKGEIRRWLPASSLELQRFINYLRIHGLTTLFFDAVMKNGDTLAYPAELITCCHEQFRARAIIEIATQRELSRVLLALRASGIKPLLLKGTPLAHTHYPNPIVRIRGDTDLLIPREQRTRTQQILQDLGYETTIHVTGEFISYQTTWSREDDLGVLHDLDVHWRVNNSQVLAQLLTYEELEQSAIEVPEICQGAYTLAPVNALLFACMHRAGHRNAPCYLDGMAHPTSDRLIWLYDVHLLVAGMSTKELDEFGEQAARKRMRQICHEALNKSMRCFGTTVPAQLLNSLSQTGLTEPSAKYCRHGALAQVIDDLLALDSFASRVTWLRELVFPSADYMRSKYRDSSCSWLPILYVRRSINGIWNRLWPDF